MYDENFPGAKNGPEKKQIMTKNKRVIGDCMNMLIKLWQKADKEQVGISWSCKNNQNDEIGTKITIITIIERLKL